MLPFLRVPAPAGGWLVVALSLSLASPVAALDFPSLDDPLREAFLFAAARDEATTPGLALAHHLGHLLRHDAPLAVSETELTGLRQSARELLAARERWGVQALTSPLLNPTDFRTAADYWRWLFEQFRDDQIPGNGYGATRIALLALRLEPELVLPHLYAEWHRRPRTAPLDQEGLRLAHLMLCHAYQVGNGWVEEVWWADTMQMLAPEGAEELENARRETLATAAALVLATRSVADHTVILEEVCRPLAHMVAYSLPSFADRPIELWAAAESDRELPDESIFYLLNRHLRSRFHEPIFLPLTVKWLGMRHSGARSSLLDAYLLPEDSVREPEETGEQEHEHSCSCTVAHWNGPERRAYLREVRRHRETVLAAAAAALPEAESLQALELAELLLTLEYEPAHEAALFVALSHLADDHIRWNSGRAFDLLSGYIHLIPDAERALLLQAGVAIGAEARDLQLVSSLLTLAHYTGTDWSPLDSPESLAFLIEQLRDDDVPDNGATTFHALRPFTEQLRPLLIDIDASPNEDWQLRRAARHLLEDVGYLGYGAPE